MADDRLAPGLQTPAWLRWTLIAGAVLVLVLLVVLLLVVFLAL